MGFLTAVVALFGGLAALHAYLALRRRSLSSALSAAYCVALGAALVDTRMRGTMGNTGWTLFVIGIVLMIAARALQYRERKAFRARQLGES